MKRELEELLWSRLRPYGVKDGPWPREVIAAMKAEGLLESEKQARRTLEKWSDRGCYEYGVSLDLGWKTRNTIEGTTQYGHPDPNPQVHRIGDPMITLTKLRETLEALERSSAPLPLFVSTDIGADDKGSLVICRLDGDEFVQVGAIVIEEDVVGDRSKAGEYVALEEGEDALRRPVD